MEYIERILINDINIKDILSIIKDFNNYNCYLIKFIGLLKLLENHFVYGVIITNYTLNIISLEIYVNNNNIGFTKIVISNNKNHIDFY